MMLTFDDSYCLEESLGSILEVEGVERLADRVEVGELSEGRSDLNGSAETERKGV